MKGVVVVLPKWSRFSPGELTKEEGIGGKSDAFEGVAITSPQADQGFCLHPNPSPQPMTAGAIAPGNKGTTSMAATHEGGAPRRQPPRSPRPL